MNWVLANLDLIAEQTFAHLLLSGPPILLSLLLALPLGKIALRVRWLRRPLLSGAALLYAIPSLPLFVGLPLILGTGIRDPLNIIVALTLYGLSLIVPAAADALASVEPAVLDAADALGYRPGHRFVAVELPLAGPALLAGLRVVSVSTISLVTVGGVLGVANLGLLFIDGFQRNIIAQILTGLLLTVMLALLVDRLLAAAGHLLLPWHRATQTTGGTA